MKAIKATMTIFILKFEILDLNPEFSLRGIKKIRLDVSTHNNIARMFYERQGYQMTPHILPNFYNNGTNAFVLNKRLP